MSLHICADSPEPSLLVYVEYGSRGKPRPNIRPLAPLDTTKWAFKGGVCAYAVSNSYTIGYLDVEILQVNIIRTGGQSWYNYFIPPTSV